MCTTLGVSHIKHEFGWFFPLSIENLGGPIDPLAEPQVLAAQLTLSQPLGEDYAHYLPPQIFRPSTKPALAYGIRRP